MEKSLSFILIMSKFSSSSIRKDSIIQEGTYGILYKGRIISTDEPVLIKVVKMNQEEPGIPSRTVREVSILNDVDHVNIVKLLGSYFEADTFTCVFQYLDMNLSNYLNSGSKKISDDLLKSYSYQLLSGLRYIHSRGMAHFNVSPSSLLIDRLGFLKLADFGVATRLYDFCQRVNNDTPSLWYIAPEFLFRTEDYGTPADIWSAGCVIAEMAKGSVLFGGDSPIDQVFHIISLLGFPTEPSMAKPCEEIMPIGNYPSDKTLGETINRMNQNLINLLERMLLTNPMERITAKEALLHPYFDDVPIQLIDLCNSH